jgi:amino acid transporter
VIGSGIFLVPGGVLRQAGGQAGPALVVWIVGGVLSLLGALAYGELGAMNPAAGGLYVYLRDAFGPLTAFLYGWTFFLVIATGSAATLAVASGSYLQQFGSARSARSSPPSACSPSSPRSTCAARGAAPTSRTGARQSRSRRY